MTRVHNTFTVLVGCFLLMSPMVSFAQTTSASLFFVGPNTVSVGEEMTVTVYVASNDVAMNAASGAIHYPVDKLEVLHVSSSGSIFDLFTQDPTFSNQSGLVQFEGIVLNPGYIGENGKLVDITFRAQNAGDAQIIFQSGAVLANDGEGTGILSNLGTLSLHIEGTDPEEKGVKKVPEGNETVSPDSVIISPDDVSPEDVPLEDTEIKLGTMFIGASSFLIQDHVEDQYVEELSCPFFRYLSLILAFLLLIVSSLLIKYKKK